MLMSCFRAMCPYTCPFTRFAYSMVSTCLLATVWKRTYTMPILMEFKYKGTDTYNLLIPFELSRLLSISTSSLVTGRTLQSMITCCLHPFAAR